MRSGCRCGWTNLLQHHPCLLLVVLLFPIVLVVQSLGLASFARKSPHPAGLVRQGQRQSSDWGQCSWPACFCFRCTSSRNNGSLLTTIARLHNAGGTTAIAGLAGSEDVLLGGESSSSPVPPRGRRRRVNETVRTIMDLLTTKFGSTPPSSSSSVSSTRNNTSTSEWDKMRRYLYRATSSSPSSKAKPRGLLTVPQVRKVLTYLDTELFPHRINLQRSVLQTSPRILSRHIPTQLRPTVAFLQSLYHGPVFYEAIARNPDLLLTTGTGYKDDGGLDLVERYLRHDLQVSPAQVSQLQCRAPLLFQTSMTQLLSVVSFFQHVLLVAAEQNRNDDPESQSASATTLPTIRRLLHSHPHLFHLSVKDNLRPRLDYLQQRCHLSDADVARLLHHKTSSAPAILGLSVRDNLQPTLDLLSQLLRGSEDVDLDGNNNHNNSYLRRTILQHPQILGLSLSNLRAKIAYFDSLDEHHHIRNSHNTENHDSTTTRLSSRILIRSPAVYSLSLRENIMPTVEYLAQIWGTGVTTTTTANESHKSTDLATLLLEYPSILTLSLTRNLQPTVAFYQRAGYYSPSSDTSLIAAADKTKDRHQPSQDDDGQQQQQRTPHVIIRGRYLAASLYHRLLPRWHFYQNQLANKHNATSEVVPSSSSTTTNHKRLPLHILAGASDADFCLHVGVELAHYTQFQTEAMPRLKFSSQFDTWVRTGVPMDIG